jgi:hypothetical protein
MIRERRPRSSSAGRGRTIRPRSRSGCSRCRHRICAGARLAVRARMAGLTAVDVDRALSDERSLAVMWLKRGTLQQKQKAPKRLAKAKARPPPTRRGSKRTGARLGASPERGRAPLHPRAARVRARPSASRSHRSVGPHTFAKTGRLVVESAMFPNERIMCRPGFGSSSSSLLRWPSLATLAGDASPGSRAPG